jgi:hypothetical protein
MGGYDLRCDPGSCSAFVTNERYRRLDRYPMGLISTQQVGDIPLITEISGMHEFNGGELGSFEGTQRVLSVDDIIAIEGARVPSSKDAPKAFQDGLHRCGP